MNSTFLQRTLLAFLLLFTSLSMKAQEYLYEIGGMLGSSFYMGDANKNTAFKNMNPSAGVLFRYNANFRIAFKGNLSWAGVSGSTQGLDNHFPNSVQVEFKRNVIDLGGQVEFNFFPYSDKFRYRQTKRISPYIAGGLGLSLSPGSGETFFSPHVSAGVGVKYKMKNRINIGAELSMRKLFADGLDVNGSNNILDNPYSMEGSPLKNKDWYSMLVITVSYDIGLRRCFCNKDD